MTPLSAKGPPPHRRHRDNERRSAGTSSGTGTSGSSAAEHLARCSLRRTKARCICSPRFFLLHTAPSASASTSAGAGSSKASDGRLAAG